MNKSIEKFEYNEDELELTIPTNDSHKMLINDIKKYPRISPEEEKHLGKLILEGNKDAIQRLIEANYRLVLYFAKKAVHNSASSENLLDCFQNGVLGLMKAANTFDVNLGNRFSTHASWWIKQSIQRSRMNNGKLIRVPVNIQEKYLKYQKYLADYQLKNGSFPRDEEIMEACGFTSNQLSVYRDLPNFTPLSLSMAITDDEDFGLSNFIPVVEKGYLQFENDYDEKTFLYKLKSILDDYEYYIIHCRLFVTPPVTLEVLSAEFLISRERIRQIEVSILNKIKNKFLKDGQLTLNIKSISNNELSKFNVVPESLNEKIAFLYLKEKITAVEYYIIYKIYYSNSLKPLTNIAAKLSLAEQDVLDIKKQFDEIFGDILRFDSEFFMRIKEIQMEKRSARNIMQLDIRPLPVEIAFQKVTKFFDGYTYEKFIDTHGKYCTHLTAKENTLLQNYFNYYQGCLSSEDLQYSQTDINMKLLGFADMTFQLPKKALLNCYFQYKNSFTKDQQILLEYKFFGIITKEQAERQISNIKTLKYTTTVLIRRLENLYFDINGFFEVEVTKEMIEKVLNIPSNKFVENQISALKWYYGIDSKPHTINEIAENFGKSYEYAHDQLNNARQKALRYYFNMGSNETKKESKIYLDILENPQYELNEKARNILKSHLIHNESYAELGNRFNLTVYQVSNIITDGIRKMDFYRLGVIKPFAFSKEKLSEFFEINERKFSETDQNIITRRYLLGESLDTIIKTSEMKRKDILDLWQSFYRMFITYLYPDKISLKEYASEINCHITDSVLTNNERHLLSLYKGIESEYNPNGFKHHKPEIMEILDINKNKCNEILSNVNYKIKQRLLGFLLPRYGLIPSDEITKIIDAPGLPISDKEKEILKYIMGLNNYPLLDEQQLAEKMNMTVISLYRRYQRAILTIRKYQNNEVKPIYDYETEIVPMLKYFAEFDRKIICKLYLEKMPITKICKLYNVGIEKVTRLNFKLLMLLNGEKTVRMFDFDYAREVVDNPDLPLKGNLELLIKIYKMSVGEDDYPIMSSKEIVDILNLNQDEKYIVTIKYAVMAAILKYKMGIKNPFPFTYHQVAKFYQEHEESINNSEKRKIINYLKHAKGNQALYSYALPASVCYRMLVTNGMSMPFCFKDTSEKDAMQLIDKKLNLFGKTKKTLQAYYSINKRDLMSGKDKIKVIRILADVYTKKSKNEILEK